jgi:hypothetical protein
MAVCGRSTKAEGGIDLENAGDGTPTQTPLSTLTNSLNQSLGLHDESPALAPFLGKVPIRRQIKVADEDLEVDIQGVNDYMSASRRWKMPFAHRNSNLSCLPVPEHRFTEEKSNAEEALKVENDSSVRFVSTTFSISPSKD